MTNLQLNKINPPFFIPVWQQGDHTILYPHTQTVLVLGVLEIMNIEKGVNALLVQALEQNIRYTLTDQADPTATSGFRLTAGNDPIAIPIINLTGMRFAFTAEAAGAVLEMQQGRLRTF